MEKRKTVNAEDIINAMVTLGFDQYIEPLRMYLARYREVNKSERLYHNQVSLGSGTELDNDMDEGDSLGPQGMLGSHQQSPMTSQSTRNRTSQYR